MNILVSAYACEPEKGSEPSVGWEFVKSLSHQNSIWVITRTNNQENINRAINTLYSNVSFLFYDLPTIFRLLKKLPFGIYLYYYLWQIGIYLKYKPIIQKHNIDIIHHITFCNYYVPSFLSLLGVPFYWGPVGGGESMPFTFWPSLGIKGIIYEIIRSSRRLIGEFDPFVRLTIRKSKIIFASSDQTKKRLQRLGAKKVVVMTQVGLDEGIVEKKNDLRQQFENTYKFVSIGRLIPWKGFHLSIEAFLKLPNIESCEYWIIGDGVEAQRLKNICEKSKFGNRVKFWGYMSRQQTLNLLANCDCLIHPSFHDSGSYAIAEALALQKRIICLATGGPSVLIKGSDNIKIQIDGVRSSKELVTILQRSMEKILRSDSSTNAIINDTTDIYWPNKISRINYYYHDLC